MISGVDGLTVLITGASGGIGREITRVFAAEGARLVLLAHSGEERLAALARDEGWSEALCLKADVRDPEAMSQAVAAGERTFGRVDIAVANAGRWPVAEEALDEASAERIRQTVEINLLGAAWTARAWMAGLRRVGPRGDGRGASLCFIGSTAGRFGEAHHADYAMAKAGLHGLLSSLKNEVVHIDPYARVNMVQPGWTVTEMAREALDQPGRIGKVVATMPLRQIASARDIAQSVLFLSSPVLARHISGEALTVAGGMEGRVLWQPEQVDEAEVRRRVGSTRRV